MSPASYRWRSRGKEVPDEAAPVLVYDMVENRRGDILPVVSGYNRLVRSTRSAGGREKRVGVEPRLHHQRNWCRKRMTEFPDSLTRTPVLQKALGERPEHVWCNRPHEYSQTVLLDVDRRGRDGKRASSLQICEFGLLIVLCTGTWLMRCTAIGTGAILLECIWRQGTMSTPLCHRPYKRMKRYARGFLADTCPCCGLSERRISDSKFLHWLDYYRYAFVSSTVITHRQGGPDKPFPSLRRC